MREGEEHHRYCGSISADAVEFDPPYGDHPLDLGHLVAHEVH
jgi:hypothetical protein